VCRRRRDGIIDLLKVGKTLQFLLDSCPELHPDAGPLGRVHKKGHQVESWAAPQTVLKAFQELNRYLSSETLFDYPRKTQPYNLVT
jgi:hypothetical protein